MWQGFSGWGQFKLLHFVYCLMFKKSLFTFYYQWSWDVSYNWWCPKLIKYHRAFFKLKIHIAQHGFNLQKLSHSCFLISQPLVIYFLSSNSFLSFLLLKLFLFHPLKNLIPVLKRQSVRNIHKMTHLVIISNILDFYKTSSNHL